MVHLLYNTDCLNISQAWSNKSEIDNRDWVLRFYQGWLILPLAAIALPLTLLFTIASVRAIKAHRVSRKFHVMLVNRALGDMLACIVSLAIVVYVFWAKHVNSHWIQPLNTFFTGCFWSGLVTYTSIGFLKLYGIARPLQYKETVTMRKCLSLIEISWALFLLIVVATMGFTLIVKIQILADWTGCKVENCLSWMYKIRNAFTLLLYLATVFCFLISLLLIRKAKRRSFTLHSTAAGRQQRSVRKRFRFPLIKLTLGVSTFAVFHLPYAIWNVALMLADGCFFLKHYNRMQALLGVIRLFVLIRIILDVVLEFVMDREIRHQLTLLIMAPRRIGDVFKGQKVEMKLSSATNSGVLNTESLPNSYETVVVATDSTGSSGGGNNNGAGSKQQQKRTESTKMMPTAAEGTAAGAGAKIQPKRHSDTTDYKRVKF